MAALVAIGRDQAAAGLAEDARKTGALITQTHPGATGNEITVLLEIAKAEFARGEHERAVKFWSEAVRVSEPSASQDRVDYLARIAAARASAGDPEGGIALARTCPAGAERDQILRSVASASADAGDAKTAVAALSAMSVEGRRNASVWRLAALHAEAGDFEAALASAAAIDRKDWKGLYVYRIARAQAAAGDPAGALTWTLAESVPLVRANGLLGVADGVMTGRPETGPIR
jgi:tetratricopeptide (TPR) repeat protein